MSPPPGRLFLIPTALGDEADPLLTVPAATIDVARRLRVFVVENARSARAFLKSIGTPHALQSIEMHELSEHTDTAAIGPLVALLERGDDVGLLSEAGCPAVADPGAPLVDAAHRSGIRVVPLAGPSSILLTLMASGLGGQQFAFVGYLPADTSGRSQRLRELEKRSATSGETILWIETPYRNQVMLETALSVLAGSTRLTIASALTLPAESVLTRDLADWQADPPRLGRTPTVFALRARPVSVPTRTNPKHRSAGPPNRQHPSRRDEPASRPGRDAAKNRRPPRP